MVGGHQEVEIIYANFIFWAPSSIPTILVSQISFSLPDLKLQ
ncbi:hypothetical protein SLEP1_g49689 [Rubroshorea leprosula]|uniref:Uncharacterized protein n=1 Tax=Rubroshorea leprosula TaxID=152421 RepID=A0AAV5M046_9ROSI|nr:hypothetical protein SLEP1_g49689 [Rubroshorea leprosula]